MGTGRARRRPKSTAAEPRLFSQATCFFFKISDESWRTRPRTKLVQTPNDPLQSWSDARWTVNLLSCVIPFNIAGCRATTMRLLYVLVAAVATAAAGGTVPSSQQQQRQQQQQQATAACPSVMNATCLADSEPVIATLQGVDVAGCCAACLNDTACVSWTLRVAPPGSGAKHHGCYLRATYTGHKTTGAACTSGQVRARRGGLRPTCQPPAEPCFRPRPLAADHVAPPLRHASARVPWRQTVLAPLPLHLDPACHCAKGWVVRWSCEGQQLRGATWSGGGPVCLVRYARPRRRPRPRPRRPRRRPGHPTCC